MGMWAARLLQVAGRTVQAGARTYANYQPQELPTKARRKKKCGPCEAMKVLDKAKATAGTLPPQE